MVLTQAEEVNAASRTTENVEDAPSSVTIVRSEELRGMGYPTIAEALRGVRGIYVSDDRTYATVGFRGLGSLGNYGNRVLVLLDGQPTNDNWIGSSYVGFDARTDLDDIERIEVVRGPGSVLYGTNAFSGVINLVTRDVDKTSGEVGVGVSQYGAGGPRPGQSASWRRCPAVDVGRRRERHGPRLLFPRVRRHVQARRRRVQIGNVERAPQVEGIHRHLVPSVTQQVGPHRRVRHASSTTSAFSRSTPAASSKSGSSPRSRARCSSCRAPI